VGGIPIIIRTPAPLPEGFLPKAPLPLPTYKTRKDLPAETGGMGPSAGILTRADGALKGPAGSLRSHGAPRRFRWIGEREVDWTDTADCNDRPLILASDHPVVMRSSSHAVNEAAGSRRQARSGVEISAAVDPPGARDNDAEPIGRISMRRAHVARMPADKHKVEAWRSAVPCQRTNVGAALRKRGLRFPLQRVRQFARAATQSMSISPSSFRLERVEITIAASGMTAV